MNEKRSTIGRRPSVGAMVALVGAAMVLAQCALGFEGRITVTNTRGGQTNTLLYTGSPQHLRIEITSTNWPHPIDIWNLKSNTVTMVYPHNLSFVRLRNASDLVTGFAPRPGAEPGGQMAFPPPPPGIGPQPSGTGVPSAGPGQIPMAESSPMRRGPRQMAVPAVPALTQPPGGLPPGIGPQPGGGAGVSGMPPMPMMPMPQENLELKDTGEAKEILGFPCVRYEMKRRGEILEIWATDKLLPYHPYLQTQPHRFGPRLIEEQWPAMLEERKLFPLLVTLHFDNGAERYRFEVKSVKDEKLTDTDGKLFQPPPNYHEIEPLPF